MRVLFDANLSPEVLHRLSRSAHDATHGAASVFLGDRALVLECDYLQLIATRARRITPAED